MRKDLEKLVRKLKRQRKHFGKNYPYAVVDVRELEKIVKYLTSHPKEKEEVGKNVTN